MSMSTLLLSKTKTTLHFAAEIQIFFRGNQLLFMDVQVTLYKFRKSYSEIESTLEGGGLVGFPIVGY